MSEHLARKNRYREQGKHARERIGEPIRSALIRKMEDALFTSSVWRDADILFLYSAIHGEVSTDGIFARAKSEGKAVYYPKTEELLLFYLVDELSDLQPQRMGIPEPCFSEEKRKHRLFDPKTASGHMLVIVPGIAFSRKGARIGHGMGYYDRFLETISPYAIKVGLCFLAQLFPEFPTEEHDIPMDYLLTEAGLYAAK